MTYDKKNLAVSWQLY